MNNCVNNVFRYFVKYSKNVQRTVLSVREKLYANISQRIFEETDWALGLNMLSTSFEMLLT